MNFKTIFYPIFQNQMIFNCIVEALNVTMLLNREAIIVLMVGISFWLFFRDYFQLHIVAVQNRYVHCIGFLIGVHVQHYSSP